MRIAYVLADPGIGVFGTKGASVHVQEIVRAFRRLGHEVTVYCLKRGDKPGRPETESVPEDLMDLSVVMVPVTGAKDAAAREAEVSQAAAIIAELAAAEGAELVYERYSLFSDAGAQLAAACGIPLVVEVNAPLIDEQRDHRSLHDEASARTLTGRLFAAAHIVSCVSGPVAGWAREVLAEHTGQPAAKAARAVTVIPNGVNTERIHPGLRTCGDQETFTIGFVGTLKPWHGTDVLLRAFAASAGRERGHWRLQICGRGPELPALEQLAERLGIADQVHFHGTVAPALVPQIVAGFDVAVAPYPLPAHGAAHYFSPLKVYEYLAAGVAVTASAVGELPEVLDDGRRGLLVTPGDVDALANAFDQLARRPDLRARLAAAGRAAVVADHTWGHRCAEILRRLPSAVPVPREGAPV